MAVSVAMATYNGEKYIKKQLDSIVKQTCVPDEVIICDDCSKDKTVEIVNDYANNFNDIKWKIIVNDKNQGYIKNFINAIKNTNGDIIILSDQDDVWTEDKVQKICNMFLEHDDMMSVHMDYSIIDQNDELISGPQIGYTEKLRKLRVMDFCRRLNYCGMSSAFRSSLKKDLLSLDVDILPTHDWSIHALAVLRCGMYISNEIVSYRRYTGNNVALKVEKKTKREGISQRLEVVNNYFDYYNLFATLAEESSVKEDREYIKKLVEIQCKRRGYLMNKSVWGWIKGLGDINFYPTKKSYMCDILYILGVF